MKSQRSLFLQYVSSSDERLIAILENNKMYQADALEVVNEIFEDRNLDSVYIKSIAKKLMHNHLSNFFGKYNIWNEELVLPESQFLSEKEVLEIFEIAFNNYQQDRLDFNADLSMYMA